MTYRDDKGREYKVMPAVLKNGEIRYITMFRQPSGMWLRLMPKMAWRDSAEKAQKDLDELAERKGWAVV